VWVMAAVVVCWSSTSSFALPVGFVDQDVARIPQLVDISFGRHPTASNSTLAYGVTKDGAVYVIPNIASTLDHGQEAKVRQVLDIRSAVCDDGERGYAERFLY
jgi:hypothetical protein